MNWPFVHVVGPLTVRSPVPPRSPFDKLSDGTEDVALRLKTPPLTARGLLFNGSLKFTVPALTLSDPVCAYDAVAFTFVVPPAKLRAPAPAIEAPALRLWVPPLNRSIAPADVAKDPVLAPPPLSSSAPLVTVAEPALSKAKLPETAISVVVSFEPSASICFVTVPSFTNLTAAPCQYWKSSSVWIANVRPGRLVIDAASPTRIRPFVHVVSAFSSSWRNRSW